MTKRPPEQERPPGLEWHNLGSLRRRQGEKWAGIDATHLAAWVADMDFPIADSIRDALLGAISSDDLGYPSQKTRLALCEAFASRLASRHDLVVDPSLVLVVSDVVQCMFVGLETLTDPGDGVLFFTPTYPPFFAAVKDTQRRPVTFDLIASDAGYVIDFDALTDLVEFERPKCLLLCNPHNPTGRAFRRHELEKLAVLALDHDMVVISDEIHADLVLPGAKHLPIASLGADIASRTVTLSSASKAFNIAGLHCAQAAFGSRTLLEAFQKMPRGILGGVSSLGMIAGLAAYENGDSWLEEVISILDANRTAVGDWAKHFSSISHTPPEATYLAWLDFSACALGDDPASRLVDLAKVVLSSGPTFGAAGIGHARLNFATTTTVLGEILDRIGSAITR